MLSENITRSHNTNNNIHRIGGDRKRIYINLQLNLENLLLYMQFCQLYLRRKNIELSRIICLFQYLSTSKTWGFWLYLYRGLFYSDYYISKILFINALNRSFAKNWLKVTNQFKTSMFRIMYFIHDIIITVHSVLDYCYYQTKSVETQITNKLADCRIK